MSCQAELVSHGLWQIRMTLAVLMSDTCECQTLSNLCRHHVNICRHHVNMSCQVSSGKTQGTRVGFTVCTKAASAYLCVCVSLTSLAQSICALAPNQSTCVCGCVCVCVCVSKPLS